MLIMLTLRKTGEQFLINPESVNEIVPDHTDAGCVVKLKTGKFHFVEESLETITKLLYGKGVREVNGNSCN